jgi:23S rRNA pseudouridine2605 synthase
MPVAEPGDPDRVLEPPLWEQLAAKSAELPQGERLQKVLAVRGWGSRRVCEDMISDGRVTVNGATAVLGRRVDTDHDLVEVDGVPIGVKPGLVYYLLNKPEGVVTTAHDPQGRRTVVQIVPAEPRVYPVGRLDVATEGLLLLTNDGKLARHIELPATGWVRRYRVRAKGRVTPKDLEALKAGVEIEGVRYGPVEASVDSIQGANTWLTISIREGKNREVRKILAHLGLTVNRLIRVAFGPFQLLDLQPGAVEAVKRRVLAEQLGPRLAQDFGLSESPEERKARHARGKAMNKSGEDGA